MALTGMHVVCGYVGTSRSGGGSVLALTGGPDLVRKPRWSETLASAGTTAQVAPGASGVLGDPSVELRCSVDAFVAIGPTPDATVSPRFFLPASETRNIYCDAGDKVAWIAA